MQKITLTVLSLFVIITHAACQSGKEKKAVQAGATDGTVHTEASQVVELPEPFATKAVMNFSDVIGWPKGQTPKAPAGFSVTSLATGLDNPRWIYVAPNGDIFVSEANTKTGAIKKVEYTVVGKTKADKTSGSADRITILRDNNGDGIPDVQQTFLTGLNQPFGMLVLGNHFYVGNTDGVMEFPYQPGQTSITAPGKKILDLPAGGYNNHWTRNLMASRDGSRIFVTVGSGSNVAEHGIENEVRRANILEINPDGSGEEIYASGLRNPQGMGFAPGTNTLWVSVNERDNLGDDLVPDYCTSVREGGFYGWPYSYWGKHEDPRMKDHQRPDMVQKAIVPDVSLGAHTASLGFCFDEQGAFPAPWSGGAFIGQHGSWNRSQLSGYRVAFIPFKNGKPAGPVQDFLTGFLAPEQGKNKVYGRPVGVAFSKDGSLLVADDAGNTIWRVKPAVSR